MIDGEEEAEVAVAVSDIVTFFIKYTIYRYTFVWWRDDSLW